MRRIPISVCVGVYEAMKAYMCSSESLHNRVLRETCLCQLIATQYDTRTFSRAIRFHDAKTSAPNATLSFVTEREYTGTHTQLPSLHGHTKHRPR